MVPSSPHGPCRSGNTTSTVPSSSGTAFGAVTISWWAPPTSARVTVFPEGATSGKAEALSDHWLMSADGITHWPDLAIPMGTTSYLLLSMTPMTPAAVTQLTACSLDR